MAFAFLRSLGSSSRKSRLIDGSLGHLPSFGGCDGRLIIGSATSMDRAFGEVFTTIAEETLATRSVSDAIGMGFDVRDAACLKGGFCGASNSAA